MEKERKGYVLRVWKGTCIIRISWFSWFWSIAANCKWVQLRTTREYQSWCTYLIDPLHLLTHGQLRSWDELWSLRPRSMESGRTKWKERLTMEGVMYQGCNSGLSGVFSLHTLHISSSSKSPLAIVSSSWLEFIPPKENEDAECIFAEDAWASTWGSGSSSWCRVHGGNDPSSMILDWDFVVTTLC